MRHSTIALAALPMMLLLTGVSLAQTAPKPVTNPAKAVQPAAEPPIQSGVYGFSGGKVPGSDYPEGVIGECIWIFDQLNKNQVAKGECTERNPGKFRVVLKPGHYVLRGPGGNSPIEVKAGEWVKVESLTLLPAGP